MKMMIVAMALVAAPCALPAQTCQQDVARNLQVRALRGERLDSVAVRAEFLSCLTGSQPRVKRASVTDPTAIRLTTLERRVAALEDSIGRLSGKNPASNGAPAVATHPSRTAPSNANTPTASFTNNAWINSLTTMSGATTASAATQYLCVSANTCTVANGPQPVTLKWGSLPGATSYIVNQCGTQHTVTQPRFGAPQYVAHFGTVALNSQPRTCSIHVEAGGQRSNDVIVTLKAVRSTL